MLKITVVSHRKNKAIERAQREFYRHLATLQADLVDGLLLVAFDRRLSYVRESRKQKMSTPLENLENQLELFIENVRQVKIIVSDFQPQGQSVLNQKMSVATSLTCLVKIWNLNILFYSYFFRNAIVQGLQEVDKLKSQVQDIHVPIEVFE